MKYTIVGGLPSPIGGVTTFLKRVVLQHSDDIELFIDIYKGDKTSLPASANNKIVYLDGKLKFLNWFFLHLREPRNYLFNFSTFQALYFFIFLPKRKNQSWHIIFHSGEPQLSGWFNKYVVAKTLPKFDVIYSLSSSQKTVYEDLSCKNIHSTNSYCRPTLDKSVPLPEKFQQILEKHKRVFIMSGYPTDIYNFDAGIEYLKTHCTQDDAIAIFIYGPGTLRKPLRDVEQNTDNVYLFEDCTEDSFNVCLEKSNILLRLNSHDSFGIAVGDAINFKTAAIATDVCLRYPGAILIKDLYLASIHEAVQIASNDADIEVHAEEFPGFSFAKLEKN